MNEHDEKLIAKQIELLKEKEDAFFERHNIDNSHLVTGEANEAHKAWVEFVEKEAAVNNGLGGAWQSPLSRKSFIVGFHRGKK